MASDSCLGEDLRIHPAPDQSSRSVHGLPEGLRFDGIRGRRYRRPARHRRRVGCSAWPMRGKGGPGGSKIEMRWTRLSKILKRRASTPPALFWRARMRSWRNKARSTSRQCRHRSAQLVFWCCRAFGRHMTAQRHGRSFDFRDGRHSVDRWRLHRLAKRLPVVVAPRPDHRGRAVLSSRRPGARDKSPSGHQVRPSSSRRPGQRETR